MREQHAQEVRTVADHLATVTRIYEAFGRGDIPFVLDQLADDVQWETWTDWSPQEAGVPWLLPRRGKEGALEFFKIIGAWTFTEFQVVALLAGANQVAAEIVLGVKLPGSGASLHDEEFHLWTFDQAGKVTRFRHYVDTAKHIAAARASSG